MATSPGMKLYSPTFYDDPVHNKRDSSPFMPRSIVHQPFFDWSGDRQLQRPWHETVIYEIHVKGFTAQHPGIPLELRGTYAGLAHSASIEYLKQLGVTAVELLPVHYFRAGQASSGSGFAQLLGL